MPQSPADGQDVDTGCDEIRGVMMAQAVQIDSPPYGRRGAEPILAQRVGFVGQSVGRGKDQILGRASTEAQSKPPLLLVLPMRA